MRVTEKALRRFVLQLPKYHRAPPSDALISFAATISARGPQTIDEEARALVARGEDRGAVARLAASALRGLSEDIDEHGEHAEYADDEAFIAGALARWSKHVPAGEPDVLLAADLESSLVATVESCELPAAEAAAWASVRKASKLGPAIAKLLRKGAVARWFAELLAAHIARELDHIGRSRHASSWMAKLDDVPGLLALLVQLGMPPLFGPRAVRYARRAAERHDQAPTKAALAALGKRGATSTKKAKAARRS